MLCEKNKKTAMFDRWVGLLVGVLGAVLLFRKFLIFSPEKYLWADNFDSKLMYWIVNWGYHILFQVKQPLQFWNANSFYPETRTLAYSDSILTIQAFFAPLKALGIPALTALYLALAATAVLGCWLTAAALKRLDTFSNLEITLIAFVTHFGLSFSSFLNHYQLFGFHFGPALFLYLYLYLRDFRKWDLTAVCALFCAGTAFASYFAPMVLAVGLIAVVPLLAVRWQQCGLPGLVKRIGWGSVLIPLPFGVLLYVVQIRPYLAKFGSLPRVNLHDFVTYSASLASLYKNPAISSLWYGPAGYSYNGQWEFAYFPGYLLLVFGLIFLLFSFASLFPRLRRSAAYATVFQADPRVEPVFAWFFVILFFAIWYLSLGPYLKIFNIPSYPYLILAKFLPGVEHIRAPGRFGIWFGLPLSIFTVLLLRRFHWGARLQRWVLALVCLAAVIESLPNHELYPISMDPKGIYSLTARYLPANTPLMELPVAGADHMATLSNVQQQLIGSTYHWARLIVGYGADASPQYNRLVELDNQIKQGGGINPMLDFAAQLHIQHYLIHLTAYPPEVQAQWHALAGEPSSCHFIDQDGYLLFQTNAANCPH